MYVLHDQKAKTSERVSWVVSSNLHSDPENAWFEMYQTWRDQDALKRNAGVSARGRKNNAPVLHYTLAWHVDDAPTANEMKAAALESLKVLGLEEHEALIVGHNDKMHPHVHVIANTVHPYTGRTAALKYSKERLSEWAEAFERDRGQIRCEERVKNNEKRRELRELRDAETLSGKFAEAAGKTAPEPAAFVPVKDNSLNRPQWFDKKDVVDRMKQMRAQLDLTHRIDRGLTWDRQRRERDELDNNTDAALNRMRAHFKEEFRPEWRKLYKAHGSELRMVAETRTHPFERAVFVFRNRNRLGRSKPLTIAQMAGLIVSGKRLTQALHHVHERERRSLARAEKLQTKQFSDRIWISHRERFHALRDRQAVEREAERGHQKVETKEISFARAKESLTRDTEMAPTSPPAFSVRDHPDKPEPVKEFNVAAWDLPQPAAALLRDEQLRRDMEIWRQNNRDRDFGREL